MTTTLYHALERAIARMYPRDVVVPYIARGATDSPFLRTRGMPVYGVPIFTRESEESRSHGNDERITRPRISRTARASCGKWSSKAPATGSSPFSELP